MAAYDLEEQEQLDELKTWWRQHGNRVTTLVLVIVLGAAGWQGWNWWQRKQTAEASAVFFGVQQAASEGNAQRVRELAGELIDKYPRTSYAPLAALLSARVQVEKGEAKNARLQLQWVADNAHDPVIQELARLRMAAILLDEKSYDEALKHLSEPPPESFVARFGELRGDIFAAQGKSAEARVAYQAALDQLAKDNAAAGSERSVYREIVQSKLDSLGSGK